MRTSQAASNQVVISYPSGSQLTPDRIGQQYDLSRRLAPIAGLLRVNSLYSVDPSHGRADYQRLYGDLSRPNSAQRQALSQQVGRDVVLMTAVSNQLTSSDGSKILPSVWPTSSSSRRSASASPSQWPSTPRWCGC